MTQITSPAARPVQLDPHFVSRKTLAARYEVSQRTIARWTDQGAMPYHAAPGNIRRYKLSQCDEIFESWGRRGLVPMRVNAEGGAQK